MRSKRQSIMILFVLLSLLLGLVVVPVPSGSFDLHPNLDTASITWGPATLVQPAGFFPQISVSPSDEIFVSWREWWGDSNFDIYIRRSDDGGQSFGESVLAGSNAPWPHALLAGDNGNVYVVWSNGAVSMTHSVDSGISFGKEKRIDDGTGGSVNYEERPDLAQNNSGILYTVWSYSTIDDVGVFFAKSTDGGLSFDPMVRVDDVPTSAFYRLALFPSVTVAPNGTIYVVWTDHTEEVADVYFSRSTDGGATFGASYRVSDTPATRNVMAWPHLAVYGNDHVYVVWTDYRNVDSDIYFARSMDGGLSFEPNQKVNDDNGSYYQDSPSIAVGPSGEILVSWFDPRDTSIYVGNIYTTLSTDGGVSFRANSRVNAEGGSVPILGLSFTAFDSTGRPHIVWEGRDGVFHSTGMIDPPCDLSKQPVLLVPGWGGSEASLAVDEQLGYFREWLGVDYVEGCNLFYTTGVGAEKDTWGNALAIQKALQNAYDARIFSDSSWDGHLDIIAHSYGGINSREYLESGLYDQDQGYGEKGIHVDNLFTMGSPHGGGTPELPGALWIAGKYVVEFWRYWRSIWQLLPWQMETFNETHFQRDDTCYRLIGGNALEQDMPWLIQKAYSPFEPNDLGVYQESAQELMWWDDKYPNVLVESTPDMHGYFDILDRVRSYVHPSDTFNEVIRPYLGSRQCIADGRVWSLAAESASSPLAVSAVLVSSSEVNSGTVESGTFAVAGGGDSVLYLNWPLGDLELSLTNPDGHLIDPTTVQSDPYVDYFELDVLASTATYVFTNTVAGTWGYTITAASLPYTMPYRLIALPSFPVAVTAYTTAWQPQGQPVVISSTLTYSVTTPLADAEIQAVVSRPDGRTDSLSLYDDGIHHDKMASDGIYGNSYPDTEVGGYYAVVVEASGTYQTESYTRTAETVFTVATGVASLTREYSDQPQDTNGDGRYEWLDVGIGISVTQVGTYTLAADLLADGGSYIDHTMLRTGLLTGTRNLTLSFDGDDILESKEDGPYIVTNVLLVDSEYASLLLDQADDVHQTAAYHHWQFGSGWRLYLPLLLRNR